MLLAEAHAVGACVCCGVQPVPEFVTKIIQIHDCKVARHGNMIVGKTGSGKSVAWKCLQRALGKLKAAHPEVDSFQRVHVYTINPLALSNDELYGSFEEVGATQAGGRLCRQRAACARQHWCQEHCKAVHLQPGMPHRGSVMTVLAHSYQTSVLRLLLQATHEWQDGVLARIMRGACKDESPDQKWILFDGPVDTLWIESMNTTLDDNKLLTLLSGASAALLGTPLASGYQLFLQHYRCGQLVSRLAASLACQTHYSVATMQVSALPCPRKCPCCLRLRTSARPPLQQSAGRA